MSVAAQLAVAAGRLREVEVGEGVRKPASLLDGEFPEKRFPDEVRWSSVTEVYARFAEVNREKLRVDIRDVKQRNVAECRQLVELG